MRNIRISADDGCSSDLRLADLCKKYDTELIFYWPVEWHSLAHSKGYKPLNYPEARLLAKDFEIGAHTITHRLLTELPKHEAEYEIVGGQKLLDFFNRQINKFAPPRGYTNKELTEFTMKFYLEQRLTKQKGLVHIHPKSGANDNKYWLDCVTNETKELWCHSWELDRFNLWKELELFLEDSHS